MALFHFTVTQTKRSKGQSAIASAAYRSGEKLYSEYWSRQDLCAKLFADSGRPEVSRQ